MITLPPDHNHTFDTFKRTLNRTHEPVIEMHKTTGWLDEPWNVVLVIFVMLVLVSAIGVLI